MPQPILSKCCHVPIETTSLDDPQLKCSKCHVSCLVYSPKDLSPSSQPTSKEKTILSAEQVADILDAPNKLIEKALNQPVSLSNIDSAIDNTILKQLAVMNDQMDKAKVDTDNPFTVDVPVPQDDEWLDKIIGTAVLESISAIINYDYDTTEISYAKINTAKQAILAEIKKREEAAYERGRIAEAKTCEQAKRHDAQKAQQVKPRSCRCGHLESAHGGVVNWCSLCKCEKFKEENQQHGI